MFARILMLLEHASPAMWLFPENGEAQLKAQINLQFGRMECPTVGLAW